MGKGDKKTKRGKITIGSYGVRRRRKKANKAIATPVKTKTPKAEETVVADVQTEVATEKKPAAKKTTKKAK